MTKQTQTDRLAEVLDCDREAAAIMKGAEPYSTEVCAEIRLGWHDATRVVQAFAHHRIAATKSLSTDLANAEARVTQLEALLFESLYHLRLDAGAKAYHDKTSAALNPGKGSV